VGFTNQKAAIEGSQAQRLDGEQKKISSKKERFRAKKERFRAENDFDPTNTKAFSSSFHSEK
jgi:hypothetical protein